MRTVQNRPAISNLLVKASANSAFRNRLLSCPQDALVEMNLPPEDVELLAGLRANSLRDYACQVKQRLLLRRMDAVRN
jgi:hypothetical protein